MRKSIWTGATGLVLALTVLGMPSISFANAINVGDGWHHFSWSGGPNVTQAESAFTFTSAAAVKVNVTDAFVSGDRFQLYDKGSLIGTTSQINGITTWTDNPDTAFAGLFSKGTFTLGAGSHALVLKTIQIPSGLDSGTAFLRVVGGGDGGGVGVASVPEPGTLVLVSMGLAGLAAGRFRRRSRKCSDVAIA